MSNPFEQAVYERGASGFILMDGKEVAHTLQCCHGGEHFVSIKGSGKRRGYCLNCQKVTCGAEACDPCVPWESRMSIEEGDESIKRKTASRLEDEGSVFLDLEGKRII
jgi:hypothetical protein